MTKARDMYDLSYEPTDSPEVRAMLKQARALIHRTLELRSTDKLPKLVKAFAERKKAK